MHGNENLVAGDFRAAMQSDGNFAVYGAGTRLRWAAGVSGAGDRLVMQTDGNAVIYSAGRSARWQSGTSGNLGARMVMQTDGNLDIYSAGGGAIWQTNTSRPSFRGNNPKDCRGFRSQAEAQPWYQTYFLAYGDIARLDENRPPNGKACEDYRRLSRIGRNEGPSPEWGRAFAVPAPRRAKPGCSPVSTKEISCRSREMSMIILPAISTIR